MHRFLLAGLLALLAPLFTLAADAPKDTSAAAFTRTKKLKGKVMVDFKNEFLKDTFKEISSQLEDNKLGALSVHYGQGISQNTRVTYAGKDVTAEEAIDGILKQLDLGYHVVSKDKDRYDGWIEIGKGNHRGYPPGTDTPKTTTPASTKPEEPKKPEPKKEEPKPEPKTEPKKEEPKPEPKKEDPNQPADPEEKQAKLRLDEARKLIEAGKQDDAKPLLKYLLKRHAETKAAAEAKMLLEKIK